MEYMIYTFVKKDESVIRVGDISEGTLKQKVENYIQNGWALAEAEEWDKSMIKNTPFELYAKVPEVPGEAASAAPEACDEIKDVPAEAPIAEAELAPDAPADTAPLVDPTDADMG